LQQTLEQEWPTLKQELDLQHQPSDWNFITIAAVALAVAITVFLSAVVLITRRTDKKNYNELYKNNQTGS
jgi:hypothetical protein